VGPPGAADPVGHARCLGCAERPVQALPARRPQHDARARDRREHSFDAVCQTGTPRSSGGRTGCAEGSTNREAQAKGSPLHSAASAQHLREIPNYRGSCQACGIMHMLRSSKIRQFQLSIEAERFDASGDSCCKEEWQADKAGMKARGVTQRGYVEQCRGGSTPVVVAPQAPPPAATPSPTSTSSSQKSAKECVAEWRADKAGMQARGVTQKAYVEQCRAGEAAPSAAAPEPRPTVAAPPTRPAPTEAGPVPAPQRPAATTTAAPTQAPVQFADEASAKAHGPADTIVWVNLPSKIYPHGYLFCHP
jgi:hypothetical protein